MRISYPLLRYLVLYTPVTPTCYNYNKANIHLETLTQHRSFAFFVYRFFLHDSRWSRWICHLSGYTCQHIDSIAICCKEASAF